MKFFVTAMILLALATSALASPRHPTPTQWRDIHTFGGLHGRCGGADDPANQPEHLTKACVAASKLQKTLTAQGFCVYGHGAVGRAGRPWGRKEWERVFDTPWQKGRKHCYTL